MSFQVAGVNHTTASLELREKLAVPTDDLPASLRRLRRECALEELVVLSTCNRLEIYFRGEADSVICHLCETGGFPARKAHDVIYCHKGAAAAEHLFSVAAGLDSMILGETEVLAQCKSAYETALEAGATGPVLNAAFQQAFVAAKRVHSETPISRGHTSVGSVGTALVRKVFDDLAARTVLVIGAGTMAFNTLENLAALRPSEIVVANRSVKKGRMLAGKFSGRAARLSSVPALLRTADVVVAAAWSPEYIVTRKLLREAADGRDGPLVILDIAVPRNVEPSAGELPGVALYNIDSLQDTADQNAKARKRAYPRAQKIVREEAARFEKRMAERTVAPLIASLKGKARRIAAAEARTAVKRLESGAAPADEIQRLARIIANKLLHAPISALKEAAANGGAQGLAEAARRLHGLKDDAQE